MPVSLLCVVLLFSYAGVPGTFRGTVVRGPDSKPGWIYVAGENDSVRRVEISKANVSYDEEVPTKVREKDPGKALKLGAEVRVTAQQDEHGEWRATEIEIVHVAPKQHPVDFSTVGIT